MRFVLVNGRTPKLSSFCAVCCEPIEASYLREIATQLCYCDRNCYLNRSMRIVPTLQYHSSASHAAPPPARQAVPNFTLDGMR
jgi:hypothetical protein